MTIDAVKLTQDLIACPSVTPEEGGAIQLLQDTLMSLDFKCHRLPFGSGSGRVENLYARWGTAGPNLCFAGHTDVVPPGDLGSWMHPPFSATVDNGILYGRGAVDMTTAIACFISAVSELKDDLKGSISLLITGDEEGPATYGTQKVLQWLKDQSETLDACIVGEPTSQEHVGDMIKIGRRGSLSGTIVVKGTQGHVAYPHLADNPIPRLLTFLVNLNDHAFDSGTADFAASNLEITSIDVGNTAGNVIPAHVRADFNIRFNPQQNSQDLKQWFEQAAQKHAEEYELTLRHSGDPFQVESTSHIAQCTAKAIKTIVGTQPEFSTSGGTSDARFIHRLCPVVECGVLNKTAHQIDECVALEDIQTLTQIYRQTLKNFFNF